MGTDWYWIIDLEQTTKLDDVEFLENKPHLIIRPGREGKLYEFPVITVLFQGQEWLLPLAREDLNENIRKLRVRYRILLHMHVSIEELPRKNGNTILYDVKPLTVLSGALPAVASTPSLP